MAATPGDSFRGGGGLTLPGSSPGGVSQQQHSRSARAYAALGLSVSGSPDHSKRPAAVSSVTPLALAVTGGSGRRAAARARQSRALAANTPTTYHLDSSRQRASASSSSRPAPQRRGRLRDRQPPTAYWSRPRGGRPVRGVGASGATTPAPTGITARNKYLYAFGGNNTLAFWAVQRNASNLEQSAQPARPAGQR